MLIRYTGIDGCNGFLAIEVNYSEAMPESLPDMRTRYHELSLLSDPYLKPAASALHNNPVQQLWLEHILAQAMVATDLYDEGVFICIAPALNTQVQDGVAAYPGHLTDWTKGKVRFVNLRVVNRIKAIRLKRS